MSSPAARAEARRKAILARSGDRLAKLTTSARGEDAHLHDDPPPRGSAAFIGEGPSMPPKVTPRPSPSPPQPDPAVWSEEQQRQFMQAIMNGALNPAPGPSQSAPSFPSPPAGDDPLAHLMAQLTKMNPALGGAGAGASAGAGGATGKAPAHTPKRPTRLQKWMPLLHIMCTWSLLAFFVLWKEPQAFIETTAGAVDLAWWKRWPTLASRTLEGTWGVQVVPFFGAFMALQVMLHALRIFTGHNDVQPPALLSIALPHLPSPLPSLIMNTLRYLRMGSAVLDDVAAIVFGIGMIVLISSWFAD